MDAVGCWHKISLSLSLSNCRVIRWSKPRLKVLKGHQPLSECSCFHSPWHWLEISWDILRYFLSSFHINFSRAHMCNNFFCSNSLSFSSHRHLSRHVKTDRGQLQLTISLNFIASLELFWLVSPNTIKQLWALCQRRSPPRIPNLAFRRSSVDRSFLRLSIQHGKGLSNLPHTTSFGEKIYWVLNVFDHFLFS